jgi:hypothetical protein
VGPRGILDGLEKKESPASPRIRTPNPPAGGLVRTPTALPQLSFGYHTELLTDDVFYTSINLFAAYLTTLSLAQNSKALKCGTLVNKELENAWMNGAKSDRQLHYVCVCLSTVRRVQQLGYHRTDVHEI